jgi:arylsulfatase A-like enzyme
VVLIELDTVRADHLGIYGYPRPTSPVIDALGRDGVVFEDVMSTAPWTLPASASLLTGLYPSRHGAKSNSWALAPRLPTLATTLSREGYATAAVVNVRFLSPLYRLNQGFERFVYVPEDEDRVRPSTWVTDQAIEWLRDLSDRRAFVFVHYYDAHSSYASLPGYRRLFESPSYHGVIDGSGRQLNTLRWGPGRCWEAAGIGDCEAGTALSLADLDADDRQHLVDLYDANLRQLDTELGRLIAFLRAEDLLEDTLIVLTADHGDEFLEHGGLAHNRTQYQEVLAVPLIFRGPGIPAGRRVSTPVSLVDVVPTVLSVLGETTELQPDGLDLSVLWEASDGADEPVFRDRHLFAESSFSPVANDVVVAVRQGPYKLVHNRVTEEDELYDLRTDPGERTNLAASQPEIRKRLREALRGLEGRSVAGEHIELSEEDLERLRELGYLAP